MIISHRRGGLRIVGHGIGAGGGGGSPFFTDGFETGDMSKTENGFDWTYNNGQDPDASSVNPRTGTYAMNNMVPKNLGGVNCEVGFVFGQTTKLWIEFYLRLPTNYYHQNASGTPSRAGVSGTSGSPVLTAASSVFVATDKWRQYVVPGSTGESFILSVDSGTQVTIDRNVVSNFSDGTLTTTEGNAANRKFFALYGFSYTLSWQRPRVIVELWPSDYVGVGSPGTSAWRFWIDDQVDGFRSVGPAILATAASGADKVVPGEYARIRLHVDIGTGNGEGIYKFWVKDTLIFNESGLNLYPQTPNYPYFDQGYYLGAWNAGVAEDLAIKTDDFAWYTANPGW